MEKRHSPFPLVSIVVPIYKPNHFFIEMLRSILKQSYQNFEIILSDDSPEDFPHEVLKGHQTEKVNYLINHGKKGIFPNLNNAIRHAKGDLIQIFCQDDIMYSDCLTEQVEALEKHPSAGMVFSDYDTIDYEKPLQKKNKTSGFSLTNHQTAINKFVSRGCLPGNLSPVMLRKKAIEKIGGFNEDFIYAGDFEYWVRLSLKGFDYVYNSACLLAVRVHPERASQTLPYSEYIKENSLVYQQLLHYQTIKKSLWKIKAYINEKNGIRLFKGLLQRTKENNQLNISKFRLLNQPPFNLFLIFFLLFFSLNGRLKLFGIDEETDF